MPFGNEMFLLGRRLARTELGEIVVEALLHLVVENDPEISASLLLDLLCGLLIEPVEIGIVVGFGGFSALPALGHATRHRGRAVGLCVRAPRRPRAGR
jgi:hypothetical protein